MTGSRIVTGRLGEAVISLDGAYRYLLNRRWDRSLPVQGWICLNPSTADGDTDDATVRRITGFTRREGFGGFCLLNAFALRATCPDELRSHPDPVGPENDAWLDGLDSSPLIVAWGNGARLAGRADALRALLGAAGNTLWCLGVTRLGEPAHPVRLAADTPLTRYEPPPPAVHIMGG